MVVILNFIKIIIIFFGSHILIKMSINIMVEPIGNTDAGTIHSRNAILWGGDDLLSRAVGLFLEARMTWSVIKVSNTDSVENLIQKVTMVKPDVVILCHDTVQGDSVLPLRLIQEQPCLKVVSVNLENNLMQVYSKRNVVIEGVSDLLCVIETDVFSNCTSGKGVSSSN